MSANKISLDTVCDFTWGFGHLFLLESAGGCWVWSDPSYGGDNTIRPYEGAPEDFVMDGFSGRFKGSHTIRDYCGDGVVFVNVCENGLNGNS